MKNIVLAGGCFWGIEEYMIRIEGVLNTKVGYANGTTKDPSYEKVCTGSTGYSEACYVEFNEKIISLKELLDNFWTIIDPTIENRQGADRGNQYRTGIYYIDENDKEPILLSKEKEQKKFKSPIVTEIESLKSFYDAEEYHQRYLKKNPNGYCHIDLSK